MPDFAQILCARCRCIETIDLRTEEGAERLRELESKGFGLKGGREWRCVCACHATALRPRGMPKLVGRTLDYGADAPF